MKKLGKRRIENIFFDMDGTLFSSHSVVDKVYKRGVSRFNEDMAASVSLPSSSRIMSFLGYPVSVIYENLFPLLSKKDRDTIQKYIQYEYLEAIKNKEASLFYDVREVLCLLHSKGRKLFIASNGHFLYLSTILRTYLLEDMFAPIVTLDGDAVRDKGDILLRYKSLYDLDALDSVMIGDRRSDKDAAFKFGCRFLYCEYGYGLSDKIDTVDKLSSFKDILNYV